MKTESLADAPPTTMSPVNESSASVLHGELVICFSTLSWDYLWLRHQELMARFARANNRVLFVEPLGIRMPKWEDRKRILDRLRNRRRAGARGTRQVMDNVWVIDPLVNPFQQIGLVHRRNVQALTQQLQTAIVQLGGGLPIFWTFVPTPLARQVIANIPHKLLIYDCMDALTENPKGVFDSFAASEAELSREADAVFVTSHKLLQRQQPLNLHTYYVPHGVQYKEFTDDTLAEPAVLAPIPHPRLTFFGGIDERVDIPLLGRLAIRHPDWQFVLLGIARTDITAFEKMSNVQFLGHIPHTDLPAYLAHSDVFLLPYTRIPFSEFINPAKLHECLAVGKPTVATAIPVFQEYRDVVSVAETTDEFEQLIAQALQEGRNPKAIEKRRARARANTWERRFAEINAVLIPLLPASE